jgi:hypothetical protein
MIIDVQASEVPVSSRLALNVNDIGGQVLLARSGPARSSESLRKGRDHDIGD